MFRVIGSSASEVLLAFYTLVMFFSSFGVFLSAMLSRNI